MKRANGTGSVMKIKRPLRRPWLVRVSTKRGRQKQQEVIGYYRTRLEAEQALAQFLAMPIEKPNITLGQLFNEWSEIHYPEISKQTRDNYNAAWLRLGRLADHKIKDIRTAELQAIITAEQGSASTKKKIKALMVLLFGYAVKNDIIAKNYAEFVKVKTEAAKEKRYLNTIERHKIEQAAEDDEFLQTVVLLYHTGFRINELLSLTPFDLIRNEDGSIYGFRGGLKTEAGKGRTVPLAAADRQIVEHWLAKNGQYIFCTNNGNRWSAASYRDKFKKAMTALGIDDITPHATRHTFFTLAAEAGAEQSIVMRIGGHATPEITRHYTHAELTTMQTIVDKIAAL